MKIGPKIDTTPPPAAEQKMREVAKSFESIFVNQMVGAMRKTVQKGGLIPESNAQRVYQSMLDTEYANKIADSNMLGLSELIYQHILRGSQSE